MPNIKDHGLYYLINGMCLLSFLCLIVLAVRWFMGELISPIQLMNVLVIFAYSLCMVGFNWPNSQRLKKIRLFGLLYSFIMMVVSVLLVNDVISFQTSWSYVVSGLTLSLMLSAIFQLFRIKTNEQGYQKRFKWGLILLTCLVFLTLGVVYLKAPESPSVYIGLRVVMVVYSLLMIGYFTMAAFTVKDDKSRQSE